jgi:hypothetical protein
MEYSPLPGSGSLNNDSGQLFRKEVPDALVPWVMIARLFQSTVTEAHSGFRHALETKCTFISLMANLIPEK